ncbi:hypothetical protein PVAP13_2NG117100 [Panicum virgatum]|uniref:DUF8039 domain-containing protein n=1 Tax=Panicum virgatum TaxID=38727 RepID=A0A8T0VLI4_PANVG|nr:hypothetical protein PVAP13_2NG117100 [Panicum virgatum]
MVVVISLDSPSCGLTATGLDDQGCPTPDAARDIFVLVCGLIARESVSINTKLEDLALDEKNELFTVLEEKLEQLMKEIASLQQRFKPHLRADFVTQDELPFEKHPFLKPEDWEEFVDTTNSPFFEHVSQDMKDKRAKHNKPHKMDRKGYYGKRKEWEEEEDQKLAAEGKENPWEQYPGRSRPYLGDVAFSSPMVAEVVDKVKRIAAQASDGSFIGVKENDLMTEALENAKHRGRVRVCWMYRKKKKRRSDVDKEEIVGEAITRVMELLRVAGVHIPEGLCITQGRKGNGCEEEEANVNEENNEFQPFCPSPEPDTIDLLTGPTKCSLLDGGSTVYPNQETCHTIPVEYGYVVVQPTYVWVNSRHIKLPIREGDEITTLGDSLLQQIQWPRLRIVIPPSSHNRSNTKNSNVGTIWTTANPKYKLGEPLSSEEALEAAGQSCQSLHAYFMEQSAKGADSITAKVAASYFESDGELSITIGFNDLYDLFNMDSLDVGLLRCWTL